MVIYIYTIIGVCLVCNSSTCTSTHILTIPTISHILTHTYNRSAPLPLGMQTRDIVQYIAERRDEANNTTYILYTHVPEDVIAAKPGIVRYACMQT